MLVLSRKAGQKILIGDEIEVTVHRISGNRVTLGVRAPRHLRVLRYELPVRGEETNGVETGGDGSSEHSHPRTDEASSGSTEPPIAVDMLPHLPASKLGPIL